MDKQDQYRPDLGRKNAMHIPNYVLNDTGIRGVSLSVKDTQYKYQVKSPHPVRLNMFFTRETAKSVWIELCHQIVEHSGGSVKGLIAAYPQQTIEKMLKGFDDIDVSKEQKIAREISNERKLLKGRGIYVFRRKGIVIFRFKSENKVLEFIGDNKDPLKTWNSLVKKACALAGDNEPKLDTLYPKAIIANHLANIKIGIRKGYSHTKRIKGPIHTKTTVGERDLHDKLYTPVRRGNVTGVNGIYFEALSGYNKTPILCATKSANGKNLNTSRTIDLKNPRKTWKIIVTWLVDNFGGDLKRLVAAYPEQAIKAHLNQASKMAEEDEKAYQDKYKANPHMPIGKQYPLGIRGVRIHISQDTPFFSIYRNELGNKLNKDISFSPIKARAAWENVVDTLVGYAGGNREELINMYPKKQIEKTLAQLESRPSKHLKKLDTLPDVGVHEVFSRRNKTGINNVSIEVTAQGIWFVLRDKGRSTNYRMTRQNAIDAWEQVMDRLISLYGGNKVAMMARYPSAYVREKFAEHATLKRAKRTE